MSHTKGTWKFNGRDIVVGQNIGQQRICTIIEHRDEFKEEDKANARLIEAAPDLFDACKELLDSYLDSLTDGKGCTCQRCNDASIKARKALINAAHVF